MRILAVMTVLMLLTTSPNGTALIEDLPVGDYLVTACAQGYKSESQVIHTDPPTTPTFALESQGGGIILWLTADPTRIPPDGTSTSAITAHVTDLEGAPLQGKSVTITTDMSTFQETSTDTVTGSTNDQGTLSATLVSLTTPNTATLTATCGTLTAQAYVEFATSTAPSVKIVSPDGGESVSGEVVVDVAVGGATGIADLGVRVDGSVPLDSVTTYYPHGIWRTYEFANGQHVLQAYATDSGGQAVYSPAVTVETSNDAFNVSLDREAAGDILGNSISLHAEQAGAGNWTVAIHQLDNSTAAKTFQGQGRSIDITWDGTDDSNQPVEPDAYE
jgi:hypothetical protein